MLSGRPLLLFTLPSQFPTRRCDLAISLRFGPYSRLERNEITETQPDVGKCDVSVKHFAPVCTLRPPLATVGGYNRLLRRLSKIH
jgi:hypothetical protein